MVGTKKTGTAAPATKKASGQPSYKDMIKQAIRDLKERNGSSRQALKKYIQANFHPTLSGAQFDAAFNKAIKAGVEKGDFTQPKGPSGPVKLAKKETAEKKAKPAAKAGEKKPATGAAATKKVAAKTGASKTKASVTKKPAAAKSTAAKPKKAATGAAATTKKANSGTKRKGPTSAPAVVDQPAVLNKTKSGRVSKGKAPTPGSTSAKRSAAGKKGAAKSPATKKAAPAKTEA